MGASCADMVPINVPLLLYSSCPASIRPAVNAVTVKVFPEFLLAVKYLGGVLKGSPALTAFLITGLHRPVSTL